MLLLDSEGRAMRRTIGFLLEYRAAPPETSEPADVIGSSFLPPIEHDSDAIESPSDS